MNFLVFGIVLLAFIVLSPALWFARKQSRLLHFYLWLRDGLWGIWLYAFVVAVTLILGIIITNLTGTLYIVYSLMIFSFPSGFMPDLGKCLLNGFGAYHADCDVFPGAFTKIFLLNGCLYFLIAVIVGKVIRQLRHE